jgi:excisionase family DNA binding protein
MNIKEAKELPIYLTLKEVAELLRVKPRTIYAWVSDKRIPYERKGGLLRFRLDVGSPGTNRPVREIEIENHALLCYPQSAPVMAATGKEHHVSLQAKGKMVL